jgi:putative transposase
MGCMGREVQVSLGAVYDLGYHVVWCPKYRRLVLAGPVKDRCGALTGARAAGHGWPVVALEVMPDHVRLLVKAHLADFPSHTASPFKGFTSRGLRQEFPRLRSRLPALWSRSCFAATAGAAPAAVRGYIGTWYERLWRMEGAG